MCYVKKITCDIEFLIEKSERVAGVWKAAISGVL